MRPPPSTTLFPYTTLFRSPVGHGWNSRQHRGVLDDGRDGAGRELRRVVVARAGATAGRLGPGGLRPHLPRSVEHTSELQSRRDLVCRLLLVKKKKAKINS